jgi:tetratricopeptide (TPR) repeat protein
MNKSVTYIILLIVVSLIAYSNTFHAPFVFDDVLNIVENQQIKDLNNFLDSNALNQRRYLGFLTFALNYHVHGLEVTGYHIVNILIHIINGLLVYVLVLLTVRTPYFSAGTDRPPPGVSLMALMSGLLFVVHPLQTQAVTYIVQRFASLATLFYLGALVLYVRARLTESRGPSIAWYVGSVLCAVCAMKTKEIAFTLPVVIALYEVLFFRGKVTKRVLILLPLMLTMLIIPVSLIGIDTPLGEVIGDVSEKTRVQTVVSRGTYLLTQFRALMTYLRLVVLPVNQNLDYDYPIYDSFTNISVVTSFLVLAALFGVALYLLYRSVRTHTTNHESPAPLYRLIGFGILWFFITISVESSVIPIIDVIFEHRMYLPLVGVFIAVSTLVLWTMNKFTGKWHHIKKALTAIVILIILSLSAITYARNAVWRDEITLWKDVVRKSPEKARPYHNLGQAYFISGRTNDAIREYKTALRIRPNYAKAHYSLGIVYYEVGLINDAIREYKTALGMRPNYAEAHNNLGIVYSEIGRMNDAIKAFQTALKIRPNYAEAYYNLGLVHYKIGLMNDAIKEYKTALRIRPNYAEAHNNLGNVYFQLGQYEKALKEYQIALKLNPNLTGTSKNLKILYEELNRNQNKE